MVKRFSRLFVVVHVISDVVTAATAFLLAYFIRFHTIMEAEKGVPDFGLYLKVTPFVVIIWLAVFQLNGFYARSEKRRSAVREGLDVIQSTAWAALAFLAFTTLYAEYRYSR